MSSKKEISIPEQSPRVEIPKSGATAHVAEIQNPPKNVAILPQKDFVRTTLKDPRFKESEKTEDMAWWRRGTVYQIMTRSFYDANGDGEGDLKGIIEKADYIADMGYKAIWLNPIHKSPHKDNGYDISSYWAVDKKYGTVDDLKVLVKEMDQRGVKVILDLVINHSSDEHPWFKKSRESKDSMVRDVYVWRPGKVGKDGQKEPPNNWISYFGGSAWEYDVKTDEYYLHKFAIGQPDLNLHNPKVAEHMKKIIKRWLDIGVAGVRMDTADIYFEDREHRDAEPNPNYDPTRDKLMHKYNTRERYMGDTQQLYGYLGELMDVLDKKDAVGIGEIDASNLPHLQKLYVDAKMHLPFNFNLMTTVTRYGPDAKKLKEKIDQYMEALPYGSAACIVFDNHDQRKRLSDKVGKNFRALTMLQMGLGGEGGRMQFVYYGDDIGMQSGPITEENMDDVDGKNQGIAFCRDFSRTPMQWDTSKNAGFSVNPDAKPWLPVGSPENGQNVKDQLSDPSSMLSLTKKLIKLSEATPALIRGKYVPYETQDEDVIVFGREAGEDKALVLVNFSDEAKMMSLPVDNAHGKIMLSTDPQRVQDTFDTEITLRPHEGIILKIDLSGK